MIYYLLLAATFLGVFLCGYLHGRETEQHRARQWQRSPMVSLLPRAVAVPTSWRRQRWS